MLSQNSKNGIEKFEKHFGSSLLKEFKQIGNVQHVVFLASKDLGIQKRDVFFNSEIQSDSMALFEENVILINSKFINDFTEIEKCISHEMRHFYQIEYMKNKNTDKAKRWREEFNRLDDIKDLNEYCSLELELDAYAYTKYFMRRYYSKDVVHPSPEYEEVIKEYSKIIFILW
mgnify:FL=1